MWVRAITIRPDLIGKYYHMLSSMEVLFFLFTVHSLRCLKDVPCDVRHAGFYMDDTGGRYMAVIESVSDNHAAVDLVAKHFFGLHGMEAFPVPYVYTVLPGSHMHPESGPKWQRSAL